MATKFPYRLTPKQRRQLGPTFLLVLGALLLFVVGAGLSQQLWPKPKIGVIYVDQVISAELMPYFSLPISYAMENEDIAAVVLIIDSPGGTASTSEELFFRLTQLRDEKPVVASVNRMAASGSYYMAIASNYIFAKPAALVGSIGVISGVPGTVRPTEFDANTGPFKGSGSSEVDWIRGMESLKNAFVSHVYEQRLYALEHMHAESRAGVLPEKDFISTGQVWFAPAAYDLGLVDELGSDLDAIEKAADLAHVANYEIVDLTGLTIFDNGTFMLTTDRQPVDASLQSDAWLAVLQQAEADPWPDFYHIYIPPTD
jgi:protease-4